jgi:hypothetical protein
MINKPDFDRAAKDGPVCATVHYFDRDEPDAHVRKCRNVHGVVDGHGSERNAHD